ncbi:MAG: hypothetical protein ACJ72W_06630 [Actinoallomurus sp.]
MTSLANTPTLFLASSSLSYLPPYEPGEVALTVRDSVDGSSGEVMVDILDHAGGEALVKIFGEPEGIAALAGALLEALELRPLTDPGDRHRVDIVRRIGQPEPRHAAPSDE